MSARFSERQGYVKARDILQINSADQALRSSLWNVIALFFFPDGEMWVSDDDEFASLSRRLYHLFYRKPIDNIGPFVGDERSKLRTFVLGSEFYLVYDLIEFLSDPTTIKFIRGGSRSDFEKNINGVLEDNHAGYRVVDGIVTPITDEHELAAIDHVLTLTDKYAAARDHIKAALTLYSQRTNPDYRNAIKEAISAVEAVVRLATGRPKTGAALDELVASFGLHPAMTGAFKQIYGYTSDGDGIRHALLKESDADAALAKFMIVACSAFIGYAIEKQGH